MSVALLRYRVMAWIVGVLLVTLFVFWGLELFMPQGSVWQQRGEDVTQWLGVAHGWLYMIFLIMAALLARRARWPLGFTAVTLVCGTVPVLSFWAERRATKYTRSLMTPV
ncbi:MAG TPA: DUF3817 domain-containing protein [Nocardioidaceae bacterium]|nr:DUF3817 domain-containing protein [Nocardioidaceae bacterium]